MPNINTFRLECQFCRTLWPVIGTKERYQGRILINPYTAICYLCEKEWGLPPLAANLWQWDAQKKVWVKWGGDHE